jgi:hypothetical protein
VKRPTAVEVEREIVALDTLATKALQQRWRELYKTEAPPRIRPGFLRRAIAYRLQELAFGGLKPQTRRQLQKLAAQMRSQREPANTVSSLASSHRTPPRTIILPRRVLSPGTRLMREWNGSTEIVEVVAEGFVWRDRPYRTLSAVAVAITGTKWSGPKFFGLARASAKSVQASPAAQGAAS